MFVKLRDKTSLLVKMNFMTLSRRSNNNSFRIDYAGLNDSPIRDGTSTNSLRQFACEVLDFSSQYGSDSSISYTAYNLTGKPSNYPNCGDFPQAFAMKTYGNWWVEAPSCPLEYMPQCHPDTISHDYVDLAFDVAVFPKAVQVYETYNPGAVVRIWAFNPDNVTKKWFLIWEGPPQKPPCQARIFSPVINPPQFKTKVIRLEFNHSLSDYYTGIDAVQLIGTLDPDTHVPSYITGHVLELNLHNIPSEQRNDLNEVLSVYENKTCNDNSEPSQYDVTLESLPHETLMNIFGYLDLRSLCRVAQVSRSLYDLATDEFLFARLSMRPYWNSFGDAQLESLSQRCRLLQRLDLSWCGNYGLISSQVFNKFINEWGSGLTHIRLNCCKFVSNSGIKAIAQTCPNLRELGLRNCALVTEAGFLHLTSLSKLTYLDFYRTTITGNCLIPILRANSQLEHLNLGSCTKIENMDDVARTLGHYNLKLISLDLWKTISCSQVGVRALSQCSKLQELDLGWCLGILVPVESLTSLAHGCPNLRKLFLTSLRGICDRDLEPFVTSCPNLEQIDLLGVHSVTPDLCLRFLMHLGKLRLLDLSFCYQISSSTVSSWRKLFPHVDIKRSNQSEMAPSFYIDDRYRY